MKQNNEYSNCKLHMSTHSVEQSIQRGIEFDVIEKIVKTGNDVKGKHSNRKYRKMGTITIPFIPKICNLFIITVLRR